MNSVDQLLLANKAWVEERIKLRPDFFKRMAEGQEPQYLWIGCSDSRVPANEITGTDPGDVFVHRNIANLVIHTDFNLLSVLQYAVEQLQVKDIIVCGHYGCGGIKAAQTNSDFGLINKWLRHIKDIYRIHQRELDALSNLDERTNRMVELNVVEQVMNLAETSIVQRAWQDRQNPTIHGMVFDLETGYLKTITSIQAGTDLDRIYRFDFADTEAAKD